MSELYRQDMLAADTLRPVALSRVAPPLAAITLRWLHDDGERVLLDGNFGVWAHGLLVPDGAHSYDEFAAIDACLLPPPAPPSLAGAGFLAEAAVSRRRTLQARRSSCIL